MLGWSSIASILVMSYSFFALQIFYCPVINEQENTIEIISLSLFFKVTINLFDGHPHLKTSKVYHLAASNQVS